MFDYYTGALPEPHFYPRPPRGGRLSFSGFRTSSIQFLSTPSARRATCAPVLSRELAHISIHALREEGDTSCVKPWRATAYFYPRPPRGGRHGSFLPETY